VIAGSSCDGQDFVADKMEANLRGARPIEEKCAGCFKDVLPQLVPRVRLRQDIFSEALGAIAAIGFLNDLEHQFRHIHSGYDIPLGAAENAGQSTES